MEQEQLRDLYIARRPDFERAAKNVREAIELFLPTIEVAPLAVTSRVKNFRSFLEKVERKGYDDPFVQNTDFVGIRILVFLPQEIPKVVELVRKEFLVIEEDDKSTHLSANQFGYRSHHLLIAVPPSWSATPNYRGLDDLKIEVQIRTVMMHAWAEMEHKLQYKSEEEVPQKLRRKLSLLSAKIEEADDQFQELMLGAQSYRETLTVEAASRGDFDATTELNLDSFKALIRFSYPGKPADDRMAAGVYSHVEKGQLSMAQVVEFSKRFAPLVPALAKLVPGLPAPGFFGYALDVLSDNFGFPTSCSPARQRVVRQLRELLAKKQLAQS